MRQYSYRSNECKLYHELDFMLYHQPTYIKNNSILIKKNQVHKNDTNWSIIT